MSLALVFIELQVEVPLRVRSLLQGPERDCKEAITKSADADSGDRAEQLDDSKVAFGHGYCFEVARSASRTAFA